MSAAEAAGAALERATTEFDVREWLSKYTALADALARHVTGEIREPIKTKFRYENTRLVRADYYNGQKRYSGEGEDDAVAALEALKRNSCVALDLLSSRRQRVEDLRLRCERHILSLPGVTFCRDFPSEKLTMNDVTAQRGDIIIKKRGRLRKRNDDDSSDSDSDAEVDLNTIKRRAGLRPEQLDESARYLQQELGQTQQETAPMDDEAAPMYDEADGERLAEFEANGQWDMATAVAKRRLRLSIEENFDEEDVAHRHRALGRCFRYQKKFEDSLRELAKAVDIAKRADAFVELERCHCDRGLTFLERAWASEESASAKCDAANALRHFEESQSLLTRLPDTMDAAARARYNLGLARLEYGETEAAILEFKDAAARFKALLPDSTAAEYRIRAEYRVRALIEAADILGDKEVYEEAFAQLEESHLDLGDLYIKAKVGAGLLVLEESFDEEPECDDEEEEFPHEEDRSPFERLPRPQFVDGLRSRFFDDSFRGLPAARPPKKRRAKIQGVSRGPSNPRGIPRRGANATGGVRSHYKRAGATATDSIRSSQKNSQKSPTNASQKKSRKFEKRVTVTRGRLEEEDDDDFSEGHRSDVTVVLRGAISDEAASDALRHESFDALAAVDCRLTAKFLRTLSGLRILSLRRCGLDMGSLVALTDTSHLVDLDLSGNYLDKNVSTGQAALTRIVKNLTRLDLSVSRLKTTVTLPSTLKSFAIAATRLAPQQWTLFLRNLTLDFLDLRYSSLLPPDLSHFKTSSLRIAGAQLTMPMNVSNIRKLDARRVATTHLLKNNAKSLRVLDASRSRGLTLPSVNFPHLTKLTLRHCDLSLAAFFAIVQGFPSLKNLDVAGNDQNGDGLPISVADDLFSHFLTRSWTRVDLSGTSLSEHRAHLAPAWLQSTPHRRRSLDQGTPGKEKIPSSSYSKKQAADVSSSATELL